jgi:pyruvate formate lyase activating enzyme
MDIGGLQKFSLADFPGRIAAIVFCRGCNFRCPYCHNPELVDPQRYATPISQMEVFQFLSLRKGQLQGVVVTGGEPTVHADLPDFLSGVRDLGFSIKLDTNGSNPPLLRRILQAGLLDYIAMDIKAPLASYERVAGVAVHTSDIEKSIALIIESGIPHEFRTTYLEPLLSPEDVTGIAELVRGCRLFVLQSFRPSATLDESLHTLPRTPEERVREIQGILEASGITVDVR